MAHYQRTKLSLHNSNERIHKLLEPYFVQDMGCPEFPSNDEWRLDFAKILPIPKELDDEQKKKWVGDNYGSRPFVIEGALHDNVLQFVSLNGIPWGIYRQLAKLTKRILCFQIDSNDDLLWMKFLLHPDGREEVLYCASVDDGWTDETPFSIIRLVLECKSDYKLLGKLEAYLVQTARESH